MRNIALYIHIPFCVSKCRYCDFTSFVTSGDLRAEYVNALCKELKLYSSEDQYNISTIYIGGGTPSILLTKELEIITETIYKNFHTENITEFSIECNPDSITEDKLKCYKNIGINRISMGVQSFNDKILLSIGRAHNSKQAKDAILKVLKYYDNVNVDLMTGMPFEDDNDGINSIKELLTYDIPHISLYSLMLESGTPLEADVNNGKLLLPNEDISSDRYDKMLELLEANNIKRYEISNFSKIGYKCKHNLNYWRLGEYIGAGLNSHGYIDRTRYVNTDNLKEYMNLLNSNKKSIIETNKISDEETEFEYIMLTLRMREGINLLDYKKIFSCNFKEKYRNELIEAKKYIVESIGAVAVKPEYFNVLNEIILIFLK